MNEIKYINAICCYGDGPDIMLASTTEIPILLMEKPDCSRFTNGLVKNWQLDLNIPQAKHLVGELLNIIDFVESIEEELNYYNILLDINELTVTNENFDNYVRTNFC